MLRPISDEDNAERTEKLMKNGNVDAIYNFACYYADGDDGLQQDRVKANELWLKAGKLGCAKAYSRLGYSFSNGMGVEADKKKAKHYYELAAMKGDVHARHNLGVVEGEAGNEHRAMKHYILAARAGLPKSLDNVKKGFMDSLISKDEYGNTLRAYQTRVDEMKSDARDAAADYALGTKYH